jgi:hypothetical protein
MQMAVNTMTNTGPVGIEGVAIIVIHPARVVVDIG